MARRRLHIDIETFSAIDLSKAGVFRYAEDPSFTILLIAYAFDNEPIKLIDLELGGKEVPEEFKKALKDPSTIKMAHNSHFEICCLEKFFGELDVSQWECTQALAAYNRYHGSLEQIADALDLSQQKDAIGKKAIRFFSVPDKKGTRRLPKDDMELWRAFSDYCRQDVEVERAIYHKLAAWPMTALEQRVWQLDYEINKTGIAVDMELVEGALDLDQKQTESLNEKARALGIENIRSPKQIKEFIKRETGEIVESVAKDQLKELAARHSKNERVSEALEIRAEAAKSAAAKYEALQRAVCSDQRIKGTHKFYGAGTGRWAGRIVQPQNLKRNSLDGENLDYARQLVEEKDYEFLSLLHGDVRGTLGELVRTAFAAPKGKKLVVADFSAIEARVIAWLAKEQWRLDVFKGHGKIYEASAAQMFNVPIETIAPGKPNYELRAKGKVAELALGYQGGINALKAMGAEKMGLSDSELEHIKTVWREKSNKIVEFWSEIGSVALLVVRYGGSKDCQSLKVAFESTSDLNALSIKLPSGRKLMYPNPFISTNRFGGESVKFWNRDGVTRKWEATDTYGGKLTENIVQAIARDVLAETLLACKEKGYKVVMHVHDEVVIEAPEHEAERTLYEVLSLMSKSPSWAPELPLRGDGFVCDYYQK